MTSQTSTEKPGTMTARVCDRGAGRAYVGVRIRTVTISDRCPQWKGSRGVDTIRNHNFHEDGEWLSVDRWDNPCGHTDMYSAVLAEARRDACHRSFTGQPLAGCQPIGAGPFFR